MAAQSAPTEIKQTSSSNNNDDNSTIVTANLRMLNWINTQIKALEKIIILDDRKESYKQAQDILRDLYEATEAGAEVESRHSYVTQVYKLLMVVTLMLGEMPDLSFFRQEQHMEFYQAYYFLTHAVRKRDNADFEIVVTVCEDKFTADNTLTLIRQIQDQDFAQSWQ